MKKTLLAMAVACLLASVGMTPVHAGTPADNSKRPASMAHTNMAAVSYTLCGAPMKGGGGSTCILAGTVPGTGLGLKANFFYPSANPPPDGPMKTFMNYSTGTGTPIYRKGLEAKFRAMGPS